MHYFVGKSRLDGQLSIPSSKSHSIRALIFAMMAEGESRLTNILESPDIYAMKKAMTILGGSFKEEGKDLRVMGLGKAGFSPSDIIDVGNSGLVFRFLTALAALFPWYTVLTGDSSIKTRRPIASLLSGLSRQGAFAESIRRDGHAPVMIRGPMQAGKFDLDGSDSQLVSALLMATSFLSGNSEICVVNAGEKPWIDLTLHWLHRLGGKVEHVDYAHYVVRGELSYGGFAFSIPGDFSTAAFPIIAALITQSSLTIDNLDMHDVQGDKKLISLLVNHGGNIVYDSVDKALYIRPSDNLIGGSIDVNDIIDAVPILAVFGCFAKTPLLITGAAIARQKESDRLMTITKELKKMGAKIEETTDGLLIRPSVLRGVEVYAHEDHRIAMALIVAGLAAEGKTTVQGVECIAKTYPHFFKDFLSIRADIGTDVMLVEGG